MPDPASAPQAVPASPFGVPLFRAVWIASLFSNFGGLIQAVGASWMMVSLGASAQMVALVQTSTSLPIMVLSLFAGAMADNLDRRRVMLGAQLFLLSISVLLALGAWAGLVTPWLLLAFTFLIGCGTAINGPAWQASIGDMVPRALVPSAVSLNSMGFNVARSLGPAIGGAIVAAAGAAAAFLLNAVSYLGLIAVLLRWRPDRPERRLPRERLGVAMIAGLRYAQLSPHILGVMFRALLFTLGAGALPALMPVIARDQLAGGALTYGTLLGGFGLGAVAGALASLRLRGRLSNERIVDLAGLCLALGTAGSAFATWLPLAVPVVAIGGAGWVLGLSTFNVTVQMSSPRWVVARMIALYQMAAFGGLAGGSWLFGLIAQAHGAPVALLAAGAFALVGIAAALVVRLPQTSTTPLEAGRVWQEPEIALPIEQRSGPIVITLEYRVAPGDEAAFLAVMEGRSRNRRRNGAHRWTLLRDLADPLLWIERYHFATWLDYVRHNRRHTVADLAGSEELRALTIGGGPPLVRRRIERQTGAAHAAGQADGRELDAIIDPARSN